MEGRLVDRAAMIEAASRSLRQQMGKNRDRPRSKGSGSFQDAHAAHLGSDPRASGEYSGGEPQSVENAQRRIRSAENKHRIMRAQQPAHGASDSAPTLATATAQPSSALDDYPVEEETPQHSGFEHASQYGGDLRRPFSRKKDPSASAAAGLGAFSSPVKMTDAFEQRKSRQPIPAESWGPRPPSRHGLPTKAAGLDAAALQEERGLPIQHASSTPSRSRSDANMNVVGGTWAAARYSPMLDARRGRERKAKDRGSAEGLGIFGSGQVAGSPSTNTANRWQNTQQLMKSSSGVFEHSIPDTDTLARPSSGAGVSRIDAARTKLAQSSSAWAARIDAGSEALEVSGLGLGGTAAWPSSPAGSCRSPPTRRSSRQSEAPTRQAEPVSVEDAEAEADLCDHNYPFRRDATPPQLIVTRSSQQKKDRGDVRRGREERARERDKSMPFSTGLDPDFLSLFAA